MLMIVRCAREEPGHSNEYTSLPIDLYVGKVKLMLLGILE